MHVGLFNNSARSLLNFDFVDSGVVDLEFGRPLADVKTVTKQAYMAFAFNQHGFGGL